MEETSHARTRTQPALHLAEEDAILAPPSFYDHLGGVYNIATVIDDFIDRIMVDARLNANPHVDEAHHRVSAAGFKFLVTEMVCWAMGGPQTYSGRSMGDSHRHLRITGGEWEAFLDDLQHTFHKFAVPEPEQDELKAIVASTRESIVLAPFQEGPDVTSERTAPGTPERRRKPEPGRKYSDDLGKEWADERHRKRG